MHIEIYGRSLSCIIVLWGYGKFMIRIGFSGQAIDSRVWVRILIRVRLRVRVSVRVSCFRVVWGYGEFIIMVGVSGQAADELT